MCVCVCVYILNEILLCSHLSSGIWLGDQERFHIDHKTFFCLFFLAGGWDVFTHLGQTDCLIVFFFFFSLILFLECSTDHQEV